MAAAMACRRDAIFCVCTGHIVQTQYFASLFWGDAKYCVSTGPQNIAFLFWGRRKILRLYGPHLNLLFNYLYPPSKTHNN